VVDASSHPGGACKQNLITLVTITIKGHSNAKAGYGITSVQELAKIVVILTRCHFGKEGYEPSGYSAWIERPLRGIREPLAYTHWFTRKIRR